MESAHPQEVIGWRCWYDSGSVYDSTGTSWSELPNDGVLVVMLYRRDGTRRVMSGNDYYWTSQHKEGVVYGQSNEYPDPARYPGALVKRGRMAPDHVMQQADADAMSSTCDS